MTSRAYCFALVMALSQAMCAAGGGARRGGLAPPDQVWGEARADRVEAGAPLTAPQLLAKAQAAREAGRHAQCADLAAESAHQLPEPDVEGRARHKLLEARCRLAADQPGVALRSLSEAWPDLRSPVDRAWASAEARDIALRGLRRSEAAAFSGRIEGDLAHAWLGVRMALLAHERGDSASANARLDQAAERLEAIGAGAELASLRRTLGGPSGGARAVGAVLPLSGPLRRVGERALRGLLVMDELAVVVRDSGGDPSRAAEAVAELAEDPAIIGVIGPLDRTAAAAAAAKAQEVGLPIVTLSVDARVTEVGDQVFQNFLDPQLEADWVAMYAAEELGLRRFAVLRPANGYGKRLASRFASAVQAAGGTVVQEQVYRRKAFEPALKALVKGPRFDALFIPDTHTGVSLLAPHLAAAGLKSVGPEDDREAPGDDRPVQLLGAGGWAHHDLLAHGADRYLQGAVFATGWFSEAASPETVRFASRLSELGAEPEVFAAYAYDSAKRLALVAQQGGTREGVRARLASARWEGPVATQGFHPTRRPDAPPHLIMVRPVGLTVIARNTP